MRRDFALIKPWVRPSSRILDLACGDGTLLSELKKEKDVRGYGLEINPDKIHKCIEQGVNVIEQDIDQGLQNFDTNSFDTVIMTSALQALHNPDKVLDEMLRVGKECIVTFPNFGHWRCRLHLSTRGRMPVSEFMPYSWFDTPNIHFCTFKDFEDLCHTKNLLVLKRLVTDHSHQNSALTKLAPNLLGEIAIYHLCRKTSGIRS
ncbi:methionine biosynthesis protein MetW [Sansalvadorimonas sp. 2012CJ34-2]|uniref:Methionine biosynthesis protein MetW n=1 Tax=Parendozoicomonas callyspongiae TaxID=2942213 RepID=A0ABT0PCI0_9GAMM|nr:methionine biosynthesis protein MetW [Sansalvadorimonas sp. 2012CJ34-2]MCL6268462.1 methionine biosynthesis protein MetW [Sansalvadorimonas sp. 2012CJ34-2]